MLPKKLKQSSPISPVGDEVVSSLQQTVEAQTSATHVQDAADRVDGGENGSHGMSGEIVYMKLHHATHTPSDSTMASVELVSLIGS